MTERRIPANSVPIWILFVVFFGIKNKALVSAKLIADCFTRHFIYVFEMIGETLTYGCGILPNFSQRLSFSCISSTFFFNCATVSINSFSRMRFSFCSGISLLM